MPEAIRYRRPTESDADSQGWVEHWFDGRWARIPHCNVNAGSWWRPIDQTPPPESEKPKRKKRIHHNNAGEVCDVWLEVLPGDPPDLDGFLQRFDAWFKCCEPRVTIKEVIAARHGEGGEG